MKKIIYLLVVAFFAFFTFSCSTVHDLSESRDESGIIYKNARYGFNLTFPSEWENKYHIEETDNTVTIYHKATWKETGQGTLFTLWVFDSGEKWNSEGIELEEMIGLRKLDENDRYVYAVSLPTDVQNISGDAKTKNEYELMESRAAEVINTFQKD